MSRRPRGARQSREPQQQRSRESHERVLAATQRLLLSARGADFTLSDVSRESGLSIGGIYRRFESREALVREVQQRVYAQMDREFSEVERRLARDAPEFQRLVAILIAEHAELLRRHAPMIKAIVDVSLLDRVVAAGGTKIFNAFSKRFQALLLAQRAAIAHPDPVHAAAFCFAVTYEVIASHFGFGRRVPTDSAGWPALVEDLRRLCLAYLTMSEPARRGRASAQRASAAPGSQGV